MILKELLDGIDFDGKVEDEDVKDIKIDSRLVEKGDLFIAIKGENFNGEDYIDDAFEKGAVGVISEKGDERVIKVDNARSAYSLVCKNFFGKACDKLKIIGVTGTNGKTTTTSITKEVLQCAGLRTGVIGTLGAGEGELIDTGFTTPDPYQLHKIFRDFLEQGVECVAMEASAHALALNKLDGIKFDIGVLTNITEDHLDFFKDMETYARAKEKLFEEGRVKLGIICCDDLYCRRLFARGKVPMLSYGLGRGNDISMQKKFENDDVSHFICRALNEEFEVSCPLLGDYNIQNILACVGICRALGIPASFLKVALSCVNQVEGRFNVIKMGDSKIIIDFAHTPDGLEKVLLSAKKITNGKLKVLFGCGGNRDRLKRPIMGKVGEDFADEVFLTSDNPRFEEPKEIIEEIAKGMSSKPAKIPDRREAIKAVLSSLQDGDSVVIAGKGGEKYQDINGVKIPYNDFDEVYSFYRNQIKEVERE